MLVFLYRYIKTSSRLTVASYNPLLNEISFSYLSQRFPISWDPLYAICYHIYDIVSRAEP
jgi:hypothetical protein